MDPDSVADNLTYLVFNDLMRFVNTTVEASGDAPILAKIFRFIEEVAGTKDVQVQDVSQDFLYLVAVAPADNARRYMGPNTQKAFRDVEAQSKLISNGPRMGFWATPPNKALQLTAR